jgi:hypothetical protein
MLKLTKEIASPIFNYAFPDFETLFAFDNSTSQSSMASDALLASRMSLNLGDKYLKMRDRWNFQRYLQ